MAGKRNVWPPPPSSEQKRMADVLRREMQQTAEDEIYGPHALGVHDEVVRTIARWDDVGIRWTYPTAFDTRYGPVRLIRGEPYGHAAIEIPDCPRLVRIAWYTIYEPRMDGNNVFQFPNRKPWGGRNG